MRTRAFRLIESRYRREVEPQVWEASRSLQHLHATIMDVGRSLLLLHLAARPELGVHFCIASFVCTSQDFSMISELSTPPHESNSIDFLKVAAKKKKSGNLCYIIAQETRQITN